MIPIHLFSEPTVGNVRALCWIWVALFAILLIHQWRSKRAFGLPLAYAFGMSLIHLPGAFAYCFAYYTPRSDYLLQSGGNLQITHSGFWMATMGFFFFVLGSMICPLFFNKDPALKNRSLHPQIADKLPGTLFLLSIAFFLVIAPITRRIPSVGALGSGGINFSIVAVFLFCHQAYRRGDMLRFKRWMLSSFAFPVVTVIAMGFMSYGVSATVAVWMLVLRFYKPRWLSLSVLGAVIFVGLSAFANWMFFRDYIRRSTVGDRFGKIVEVSKNLEVFNPYNQNHLEAIDSRLNQNDFVGKAMIHTGFRKPFAKGETFVIALTAWIPRILWPTKKVLGGSGNLVTNYTGQVLNEDTSFGVGQVLEFYINFGAISVAIGFLIFGMGLTFLDQRAAFYLNQGDYWNVTRWMTPALAMIQPNGALGELVSAGAAAAVLVYLLHQYMFGKYYQHSYANASPVVGPNHQRGSRYPRNERVPPNRQLPDSTRPL